MRLLCVTTAATCLAAGAAAAKTITVAADGSGDVKTLTAAIAAAPDNSSEPTVIRLGAGVYDEGQIIIPKSKAKLKLEGDDAGNTVITYAHNMNEPNPPDVARKYWGIGVMVLGDDFEARNLTFRNTSGDHGQANALRIDADRAVVKDCRLLGWQDTLRVDIGRQYFKDCYVEGRVDFIYGSATAVFENCEIHSKNGGFVTAADTPPNHPDGLVFLRCRLTADAAPWNPATTNPSTTIRPAAPDKLTYLGRPWRPFANVMFVDCEMGEHIRPEGWNNWGNTSNEQTARYAEFGSTGPGANPDKRAPWSKQLTEADADAVTVGAVLGGKDHWDATSAASTPALPDIPDRHFAVTDYGAVAGGSADNTNAVQSAIDAAAAVGGGIVDVPAGNFLCGPVVLASRINLHLADSATLRMLPIDRYPGGTAEGRTFLGGQKLHDVAVTGRGTIDGQGATWWPLVKTLPRIRRPRMIALDGCDRVLIDGVRLMNSPMFHIAIAGHSTNVTVRGVTIRAPASTDPVTPSHNTDACDVSGRHILIQGCDVSVGDDDFTCGGGTSDVRITNCTYGFGHGVSIGSPTAGGVSDFTVDHCTFTNTDCGIRIKSDRGRGGAVHDLIYRDLQMTNVGIPILIYAAYLAPEPKFRDLTNLTADIANIYPVNPLSDRTPIYRDISFIDITATASPARRAGLIWGLPEAPVANVLLRNVNITADKPLGIFFAHGVRLEHSKIVTPAGVNSVSQGDAQVVVTPP